MANSLPKMAKLAYIVILAIFRRLGDDLTPIKCTTRKCYPPTENFAFWKFKLPNSNRRIFSRLVQVPYGNPLIPLLFVFNPQCLFGPPDGLLRKSLIP